MLCLQGSRLWRGGGKGWQWAGCSAVDPRDCSTALSDLAAWLLPAQWRQTQTWICHQKPPLPELKCCLEMGCGFPDMSAMRPFSTWVPVHEGSDTTIQLTQQEPTYQEPVLLLHDYFVLVFNGAVGLFSSKRRKLLWVSLFLVVQFCVFTGEYIHAYVPKTTRKGAVHSCVAHSFQECFSSQLCLHKFSISTKSVPAQLSPLLFLIFPGFQPLNMLPTASLFPQRLQLIPSGWILAPDTISCYVLCKLPAFFSYRGFQRLFFCLTWRNPTQIAHCS